MKFTCHRKHEATLWQRFAYSKQYRDINNNRFSNIFAKAISKITKMLEINKLQHFLFKKIKVDKFKILI